MIESVQNIINLIGSGNVLAIVLFFISIFIAFYLYFKTFFRLAFTTEVVCKNCNNLKDWHHEESEFVSRVLFYNNGRKTITKAEIQDLELKSSNTIKEVKQIVGNETIKLFTKPKKNSVNIEFQYLDSSDFFVLEIKHKGKLIVNGRIHETGKLLQTEPKYWLIMNVFFIVFFFIILIFNIIKVNDFESLFTLEFIVNIFIFFGIFYIIRIIHSILFIPDNLCSKFLTTKDKFSKEFKN